MDDDTVPEPGALQAMLDARALPPGRAARADRQPGGVDRRAPAPDEHPADQAVRQQGGAPRRGRGRVPADPVGVVRVDPGRRRRLPRPGACPQADYFLWNDDFEFTARLLRGQAGLLCPASVVVHKTAAFGSTDADPGQRFFYEVRNKVWTLRAGSALAPAERLLYGGSTLRRWARTFAKSSDRRHAPILPDHGPGGGVADQPTAHGGGAGVGRPGDARHCRPG